MMRFLQRVFLFLLVAFFSIPAVSKEPKLLTRSIYVPVHVDACPHLRNVRFFENDLAVTADRIFQFTYYPADVSADDKPKRILPEQTGFEFTWDDESGPHRNQIIVTPEVIFLPGGKRIELPVSQLNYKLRFRRDFRYQQTLLHLDCGNDGKSKEDPVAANQQ